MRRARVALALRVTTGELTEIERLTVSSERGGWKSAHRGNSLAAYSPARTVLPTSGGSDPFAEFNRQLRHAVLWRKSSYGTQSHQGSRFVEAILTVVSSCEQQGRNVLTYLTACCRAFYAGRGASSLLPQTSGYPLLCQ
jgi:transposase